MGATYPIVLPPRCPGGEDQEVQGFLRLAIALSNASWAKLELQPNGPAPAQGYLVGSGKGSASVLVLEVGGDFEATLRLGKIGNPEPETVRMISKSLGRILEWRRMLIQTELLIGALDSTSSSLLLFDDDGEILYANPSADRLLSLQTEDEIHASSSDRPRQPLFTLLSSLVETVATGDRSASGWNGVLDLDEGRVVVCEATRLPESTVDGHGAVLIVLHPVESETSARVQAISSGHGLSPRENEVLELLGQGLTTSAMAESLGISPHTVRDHLKHLYRKTGTTGRNELLGLISRST